MLWGAKESAGASTFKIMAMGMRSTLIGLKQPPHNLWENGVYWYSVNSKSNGFAPNSHVQLNSADVGDLWDNCHRRLSWHLGQSVGGYRVGCAKWLNSPHESGNWRKVVMYGPCGAGAFLQVSNASTSKKSSALEVSTKKRRVEDSCQPVNCGAVPTVAFCSPDKDTAVYGDSIKYTCEEGYTVDGTAAGQTHFSITCEADARLTSPGECQRIACGAPEAQANAVLYPVAMYYKDEISITCESGYTFTGKGDGETTYKRECQKDGELTELKECKPIECGDIRDELSPLNGVVDSPGIAKYPSVSEVTCDEGYTIDGLPVPDPAMPMKIGIQLDIKVDEFTSKGWRTHYDKPYSHHTTVADLLPPEGDCILWGAKTSSGTGYFKLAGMGKRSRLLALKNWPYATTENGFYWYMKPTQSAGLAAHMSGVALNSADVANNQCERRLSWHMGQNVGGYRAGCTKSLNGDGTWRKVVMYGPCTDLYAGNQEWHLAPPGAHECDAGSPAPEAHCQQIVKEFASDIGKTPGRGLQIGAGGGCMDGGWGQVPLGCSAQSGGDWAGHFKKSGGLGAGCIHSAYQLVCSGPSSHQGESTFNATMDADNAYDELVNLTENDSQVSFADFQRATSTLAPVSNTQNSSRNISDASGNNCGPNSHEVIDRGCRCNHGYDLSLKWSGSAGVVRKCSPAECLVHGSNQKPGKACACAPGYDGNITWFGPTPDGTCTPRTDCPNGHQWISSYRQCMPVPCDLENSNRMPGLSCACKDGFEGSITWRGSEAHGRCVPLTPDPAPAPTPTPVPAPAPIDPGEQTASTTTTHPTSITTTVPSGSTFLPFSSTSTTSMTTTSTTTDSPVISLTTAVPGTVATVFFNLEFSWSPTVVGGLSSNVTLDSAWAEKNEDAIVNALAISLSVNAHQIQIVSISRGDAALRRLQAGETQSSSFRIHFTVDVVQDEAIAQIKNVMENFVDAGSGVQETFITELQSELKSRDAPVPGQLSALRAQSTSSEV